MPWNDITDEGDYVFPSRERELLKRLDELSEFEADERKQVLKALEAVNTAPLITGITIAGERPSERQIAALAAELDKVPVDVISSWRARGGRAEIVPGQDAARHPLSPFSAGIAVDGWYSGRLRGLVVVAAAKPICLLHEIGHATDHNCRFSASAEWRKIDAWENRHGILKPGAMEYFADHHRGDVAESWAQSFALYHHDFETWSALPKSIRRFVESAVAKV